MWSKHDFDLNEVHSTTHMTILLVFQRIFGTKKTKKGLISMLAHNTEKAFLKSLNASTKNAQNMLLILFSQYKMTDSRLKHLFS